MRWFYAGQNVSVGIDYMVDDQFVLPTSATYSVRSLDGTVLVSGSLPAAATSEPLLVDAAYNALGVGNDFEQRFVTVFFIYENQTYQFSMAYGIFSFIPMAVTPQDVRREIGLDRSELPDDEIDLIQAYFTLVSLHSTSFTDAFTEQGIRSLSANRAVALQAAIDIVESLPLRAFSLMRSEDAEMQRFSNIDFEALSNTLRNKLTSELQVAKNLTPETLLIFDLTNPTDVITNT